MTGNTIDNDIKQRFVGVDRCTDIFKEHCRNIAEDIVGEKYTIASVIEALEFYLVNVVTDEREYGMHILSDILMCIPLDFLNEQQLRFISAFYCDRLKDHHQVIPGVLKGILRLVQQKHLPSGACTSLLSSIFQNISCQQQQFPDRHNIYNILKFMLENWEGEIKTINYDYIYNVISAMDGERDPRNLMFLFAWLPKLVRSLNFGHLSEEMFEVMACYFPVDFRVPMEEAYNISRDTLAKTLAPCLCAIPEFAQYCLPLIMEKLQSSLKLSKLDSLELLCESMNVFPAESYFQHSTEIWSQLQREVLSGGDEEIETACLVTLTRFISKMSEEKDKCMTILQNFTDTLKGNIRPDVKLFIPTIKLLLSVARGSRISSLFLANQIAPLLINLYSITETLEHRLLIFKTLIDFTVIYTETQNCNCLAEHPELCGIPMLCLKAITDSDILLQSAGLEGLKKISKIVPEDVRKQIYEYLRIYLPAFLKQPARSAVLECFKTYSQLYSLEVMTLLHSIKIGDDLVALENFLNALLVVSGDPNFTPVVIKTILENLVADARTIIALKVLKKLIELEERNDRVQQIIYKYSLIESSQSCTLLQWLSKTDNIELNNALYDISAILNMIVGYQDSNEQNSLISLINEKAMEFRKTENPVVIFILFGLITRLRQDVLQHFDIITILSEIALKNELEEIMHISNHLLANMINKLPCGPQLDAHVSSIAITCSKCSVPRNLSYMVAWIAKALIMRGYDKSDVWIYKLIELLEIHREAAIGFRIVMKDEYDFLSSKSYANKKLLYRQKFFSEACRIINEKYDGTNENYLFAFGYMLQETPFQMLKLYFEKVIRLVILCLDKCPEASVLISVLEAVKLLLENHDELGEKYLQEFIPRLLKLTKYEHSMKARILSIQCLCQYTKYTLYKLLPHKTNVIFALADCLDDKKRLVRKEAVNARLKWYLIDAPI